VVELGRALALILVSLLVAPLCCVQRSSGDAAFGVGSVEWIRRPRYAGDVGAVRLSVYYAGDTTLVGVSARVDVEGPAEVVGGEIEFPSWEPGETKVFEPVLKVYEIGAELRLSIVVEWKLEVESKSGRVKIGEGGVRTIAIDLVVPGEPRLSVLVEPLVLAPDSANSVTISIANEGSEPVENLRIDLEPQGLALLEAPVPLEVEVPLLEPGGKEVVQILAVPLVKTPALKVRLEYLYRDRLETLEVVENLYSGPTGHLLASAEPALLQAGGLRKIVVVVENRGVVPARSAVLKLYPPLEGQIVFNETTLTLGDVEPLGRVAIPLQVLVPAEARGCQRVEYEVSYRTPGGGHIRESGWLVLGILAPAELRVVSIDVVPSEALVNKTLVVSLTVVNVGASEARDINATLRAPEDLEVVRRPYSFVGRLAPQEPTTIAFSLKPRREGEYRVEYAVRFADPYGIQHELVGAFVVRATAPKVQVEAEMPEELVYASAALLIATLAFAAFLVKRYGVRKR